MRGVEKGMDGEFIKFVFIRKNNPHIKTHNISTSVQQYNNE